MHKTRLLTLFRSNYTDCFQWGCKSHWHVSSINLMYYITKVANCTYYTIEVAKDERSWNETFFWFFQSITDFMIKLYRWGHSMNGWKSIGNSPRLIMEKKIWTLWKSVKTLRMSTREPCGGPLFCSRSKEQQAIILTNFPSNCTGYVSIGCHDRWSFASHVN